MGINEKMSAALSENLGYTYNKKTEAIQESILSVRIWQYLILAKHEPEKVLHWILKERDQKSSMERKRPASEVGFRT